MRDDRGDLGCFEPVQKTHMAGARLHPPKDHVSSIHVAGARLHPPKDHVSRIPSELLSSIWSAGLDHRAMAAVCCVSRRWRRVAGPQAAAMRALAVGSRADICLAIRVLANAHKPAVPHVGTIATHVEHADRFVRIVAVDMLGMLGEHAAPHVGAIVARLEDADAVVRSSAMEALGRLGEHAAPHARAIVAQMEHAVAIVRWAAVEALGGLGSMQRHMLVPLQHDSKMPMQT
ncbi:hypothetical protein CYMTET_46463 [Cymbomonas tetramitiformis]|uniref:F-box domain-containing protein n=1 Tax=Cymbomonas tetramitiformis TaxID=36881 RepID=A0AAE0EX20_9CHLO|nr:hypothetical protein CYMTET_46463 [Cymbomonas tetramitiformis]